MRGFSSSRRARDPSLPRTGRPARHGHALGYRLARISLSHSPGVADSTPGPACLSILACFERYSRLSHAGFLPAERVLHRNAVGAARTAPIGAAPRQADRVATRIGVHHRNSGQRVGLHGGPVCNCILAVLLVARLPPPVVSLDAPLVVRRFSCARAVGCEVFPPYALVVVSPAYAGAADADARTDCRPRYVRWNNPASARAGLLRLLLLFRRFLLSASIRYAPLVGVGVAAGAIAGIPGCPCAVISFRRNGVGGTSLGGVPGDYMPG